MAEYDRYGATLLNRAQAAPEYRCASPMAQRLSQFTGFLASDIDIISNFCASKDLLLISRCPDFNANAYSSEVKSREMRMKPCHIKKKTGAHGVLYWGGTGYVSDYDLMCVHRLTRSSGLYEPLEINWDGQRTKTAVEEEILGGLNRRLTFKLQHGCNDSHVVRWADGSRATPKNKHIGDEFLVFRHQEVWAVFSRFELRTKVYERFGLKGWHAEYGG